MLSEFADDPEMQPLIGEFLAELGERLSRMQRLAAAGDHEGLGRLAHQLKGAGGGYGYPAITAAAAGLETAARGEHPAEQVAAALQALQQCCDRAIASFDDGTEALREATA